MTNGIIDNPALKQFHAAPYRKIELDPSTPSPLFPSICCETPGGDILVIDDLGHAAFLFTPSGKIIRRIGGKGSAPGQFNHPTAAAIAPDGRIFITDSWNHRVQIFTPELNFISTFGSPGNSPGQLLEPSGVALFNGNLVISERENRRLSIFEQNGNFICSLRSFSGLENPLSYITSLAVVGRFLATLMDSSTVLIFDEHFICENIISLTKDAGPHIALYAAGEDVFIVASYTGDIVYYALDGCALRVNKSIPSNPLQTVNAVNGVNHVHLTAADLTANKFEIVAAPPFEHPLYRSLERIIEPANSGLNENNSILISGICASAPDISPSRVAEFNKATPDKFRAALLRYLLQSGDNIHNTASNTAINILKRTPAISAFHKIAASAPAHHAAIYEYAKKNSVALIEQIDFSLPGFEGKRPYAFQMPHDGEFIVYLLRGGLIKVNRTHTSIISLNEIDDISLFCLAYDGSYVACTLQNELIHIAPDGRLIRKLTQKVPQELGYWRQVSSPRTNDGRIFTWPDFATGSLDTFDLFCSTPHKPIDRLSLPSGAVIDIASSPNCRDKFVLTSENTILTLDEANNIKSSHSAPMIEQYTTVFIATTSDGGILTSHYKITHDDHTEGYPQVIVKIDTANFDPLFFVDSFSTGKSRFQNVIYPKYSLQPIPAPDNCFWLLDRFKWTLSKFKIGASL